MKVKEENKKLQNKVGIPDKETYRLTDEELKCVAAGETEPHESPTANATIAAMRASNILPEPIKNLLINAYKTLGRKAAYALGVKLTKPETKERKFVDGLLKC